MAAGSVGKTSQNYTRAHLYAGSAHTQTLHLRRARKQTLLNIHCRQTNNIPHAGLLNATPRARAALQIPSRAAACLHNSTVDAGPNACFSHQHTYP